MLGYVFASDKEDGMKIIKWDPFKDTMMVDDFFEPVPAHEKEKACNWSPAVDVYETGKDIVMTAELPGVKQEEIDLTVYENILTLKGDRKFDREVRQENYHRVERNYGYFCRRFVMPCDVQSDQISAAFKDGVLTVVIPKKSSRKVHVKVKEKG